jgi:hypothetical protein
MIAQQSPILEKAANTLLAFSEDEIARDRLGHPPRRKGDRPRSPAARRATPTKKNKKNLTPKFP